MFKVYFIKFSKSRLFYPEQRNFGPCLFSFYCIFLGFKVIDFFAAY